MLPKSQFGFTTVTVQSAEDWQDCDEKGADADFIKAINGKYLSPEGHYFSIHISEIPLFKFIDLSFCIPGNHPSDVVGPPPDFIV